MSKQNKAEYKENKCERRKETVLRQDTKGKNWKKSGRKVPVVRESWLRISCQGKEVQ